MLYGGEARDHRSDFCDIGGVGRAFDVVAKGGHVVEIHDDREIVVVRALSDIRASGHGADLG